MYLNIRRTSLLYLVVLAVITEGAVYYSVYAQESYVALAVIAVTVLLIAVLFQVGIPKWFLGYCIATAACYFMSAFMNGIGLSHGLNIKTALLYDIAVLIVIVALSIDYRKFINYFVGFVVLISAISLIFYAIQAIAGRDSISGLFTYLSWGRGHYVNPLYTYAKKDTRNYGIFYEPGVFQIVTITALYLLVFGRKYFDMESKKYIVAVIILGAAVLTGGSTTGYINLLFIVAGTVLMKGKSSLQKKIAIIFGISIAVIFLDYLVNADSSILSVYVLDKIFEMTESGELSYYTSSGGARLFMFNMALRGLKENPLFGIGNTRVETAVGSAFFEGFGTGNGLCVIIASKGLVTACTTIVPFLVMSYRKRQSIHQYVVLLLIYFNTIVAQSSNTVVCCAFVLLMMTNFMEDEELLKAY